MEKRILWTSDLSVTKICLWTMTRGHQNTEAQAHEQLDYAIDQAGINFIDTAEIYAIPPMKETQWTTETFIGNWLAKRSDRKELIIATKVVGRWFEYMRGGGGFTPEWIRTAVQWSLSRLQTDYIDLYQLHRPQRNAQLRGKMNRDARGFQPNTHDEQNIIDTLKTLKEFLDKGVIRYIGLSNETPWGVMKFKQLAKELGLPIIQTVQNAYNLVRREFDINLSEVCMHENISLLAYSPLAWGILTGKYQHWAKPEWARYTTRGKSRMPQYVQERVFSATEKYILVASKLWISAAQIAIAWVNDRPFTGSNIIWATSMKQLKECISSADITLDQVTLEHIDQIHSEFFNPACF